MVVANPKAWLQSRAGSGPDLRLDDPTRSTIGILAFETAAAMTRLVSLHRSLSDQAILKLRSEAMRSQGVAYLNSTDQHFLLRLACADMMDDLDRTAAAVSRLGDLPRNFYADPRLRSRGFERAVLRRMERYVAATAKLCEEVEVLAELEASERKMEQRRSRYSWLELKSQRQKVRRLKQESLWGQSSDKAVGIMARAAAFVFARICVVFEHFVPGLPPVIHIAPSHFKLRIYPRFHSSGPMERQVGKEVTIRSSCPILSATKVEPIGNYWSKMLERQSNTVGESGLALRYAKVIVLAERLLLMRSAGEPTGAEEAAAREEVYEMLPEGLRAAVRGKLRGRWRTDRGQLDGDLAEGWKEAVERILRWLGPVAHDTVQWQAERNMDRRRRFDPRPRVLMLQTLHFSDREKTEAAIAEVLVGLSCMCWYDERRLGSEWS